MNRRIETRVVVPAGAATATLINKDASEVYWITAAPNALVVPGLLQIFDGFDITGKPVWEGWPVVSSHYNFIPPIHCEQGVFVQADVNMGVYTIGFRPKKWDRPPTHPEDVITAPKA